MLNLSKKNVVAVTAFLVVFGFTALEAKAIAVEDTPSGDSTEVEGAFTVSVDDAPTSDSTGVEGDSSNNVDDTPTGDSTGVEGDSSNNVDDAPTGDSTGVEGENNSNDTDSTPPGDSTGVEGTEENTSTTGGSSSNGGSSSGGRVGGSGSSGDGEVLGAFTGDSCGVYLNSYLRLGYENSLEEVVRLQTFLRERGYDLLITGFFGQATDSAVRAFQSKYTEEILEPWTAFGFDNSPSGYVYKTTKWKINNLVCPGSEAFPLLP